eukprot:6190355-Pleurochrysis_carterae.AAC.2
MEEVGGEDKGSADSCSGRRGVNCRDGILGGQGEVGGRKLLPIGLRGPVFNERHCDELLSSEKPSCRPNLFAGSHVHRTRHGGI